ncbi:MAG: hypothetical protein IJV04_08445, partial [Lachnospiraceae bacterium]|nr:hypothetical protein [Lachnospiraceae bacterium]
FLFELYKFIATLMDIKKPKLTENDEEEIKRRAIEEYLAEQQKKNDAAPADSAEAQTEEKVTVPADTAEAPADDPSQE